jgi:hypothetical protein
MNLSNESVDLSLCEAIKKMRAEYSDLMQGNDVNSQSWFLNHDATHVIFATAPFELKGEMLNDVWTIFGSTVSLKEYAKFFQFTTAEKTFAPYAKAYGGKLNVFLAACQLIPSCVQVLFNTRKMTKNWPWHINDTLLQKTVTELRREFGIQII